MKRLGSRYSHFYNGQSNSRGRRHLSKIHKGMNCGDVEKAFKEVELLELERERK
jgi:hypothetical protein